MFVVLVRSVTGSLDRDTVQNSLAEAVSRAIDLTDALGASLDPSDPRRAKTVEVRRGDHLEVSMAVVSGGLLRRG